MKKKPEIHEDKWLGSVCGRCYGGCGIRVHVINGVAVKIEGEPNSTQGSMGGVCAKGASGLQVLYDPNRLNVPLRRTNPEKGLFSDPKWKEITWEEAFAEIVPRIKKIMNENPRKLMMQSSVIRSPRRGLCDLALGATIGGPSFSAGGAGLHCGEGAHPVACLVNSSWSIVPDFKYCNYAIYFGTNKGVGSGHSMAGAARRAADARARGCKVVSFDPMCNFSGGKATEWVPIIPGTDGAVILAMCNVILNEMGVWDAQFLKTKTNAPYLIGLDGHYVREKGPARGIRKGKAGRWSGLPAEGIYIGDDETNKPLVWDAVENKAKVFDDPGIKDYALDGNYEVSGVKCQPAFQAVKEHLKSYTPEMASGISSVPAKTIRRVANEFATAASIGSTITVDGHNLPLRPASATLFRGAQGHENSFHTCFAVALLNQIIGSEDVPGGTVGWPARSLGFPGTGELRWSPYKGVDGMLETDHFGPTGGLIPSHGTWPIQLKPNKHDMTDCSLFPTASGASHVFYQSDQEEIWEKLGTPIRLEMMISWGNNPILSVANREIVAECLKKIPFIVGYDMFTNEFTEGFADIVLPSTCYLEEASVEGFAGHAYNHMFGLEDWSLHIAQPVVPPKYERRQWENVAFELVDRLGVKEKYVNTINEMHNLGDEYKLSVSDRLSVDDIINRLVRKLFGKDHDWEWFKKNGFIRWPRKVEETYWRYFVDARTPIYLEFLLDMGDHVKRIASEIGLQVDYTQFTPFISWTPCSIHKLDDNDYDLYCFSYRDVLHTGSSSMEQPWLDEASRMNPYTYHITINSKTAADKGLRDGDLIEVESCNGRKVEGILKTMDGQHPSVLGIAAQSGHWAKGQPIAKGKGTNFDILLELDHKHLDPVSSSIETCVRARVRKAQEVAK